MRATIYARYSTDLQSDSSIENQQRLCLRLIDGNLPQLEAVAALDKATDSHCFIEVHGGPGVGKSWVLRNMAERVARQSPIIMLDPIATPSGGWIAFAQAFGIPGTASDFLSNLAASGGAMIFINSLDMFTDPGNQRTVFGLPRIS